MLIVILDMSFLMALAKRAVCDTALTQRLSVLFASTTWKAEGYGKYKTLFEPRKESKELVLKDKLGQR
jgi:hypothetical protein